ncbi:MAG: phage portal protein [Oscillospiraceae bacterium]|nr:phage portal protein [Oscillospiraceae bacterium]
MIFSFNEMEAAKAGGTLEAYITKNIDAYTASADYADMLRNEAYYNGENPALQAYSAKVEIKDRSVDVFAKIRVPSGIFRRLIVLQVNRLWYNGVQLDNQETKDRLGKYFDNTAKDIATNAAIHKVCYGFWNFDRLQMFTAKEYFPLKDERTGADKAGIRFWQLEADKPWTIQLFELDGWTEYTRAAKGGELIPAKPKQAYSQIIRRDAMGEEIVGGENYIGLPVIAMYANKKQVSELTPPIRAKIDLYDAIMTTFGDTSLKTKVLYWVLEGMSGNEEHLTEIKNAIERLGIIAPNGDAKATPETIDLPYEATMKFLEELEKAIFRDAMITNPQEITGGNLTATAINASYHAEKLKVSDMEWQAARFVDNILELIGIKNTLVKFKHETVSNDMEITQRLNMYSELPFRWKLVLDPLFPDDSIELILDDAEKEQLGMAEPLPEGDPTGADPAGAE